MSADTSPGSPPLNRRILVVEDDDPFRTSLTRLLQLAGYDVSAFSSAEQAVESLELAQPDLVLTDLELPRANGLSVLKEAKQRDAELPVVLMTGHGDIPTAIQAIKDGADDFMEKPFGREKLLAVVSRAIEQYRLVVETRMLKNRLAAAAGIDQVIVGTSPAVADMRDLILRLSSAHVDVMITGATGTGKELVARCLHDFSAASGPFVAVNCAAIPEDLFESELFGHEAGAFTGAGKQRIGKIEYAKNGTLFLDEIEAMPLTLQAKVLRALQEREVERLGSNKPIPVCFRLVSATKEPLDVLSKAGKFRSDLYYRLNVAAVHVPALRERTEDIITLFRLFLQQAALRFQMPMPELSIQDQQLLLAYDWPGNVRELKSCAERHALGLPLLTNGSAVAKPPTNLADALAAVERSMIEDALRRHGGSVKDTCQQLGLTTATFYRRLKALDIDTTHFRQPTATAGASS
ncbi:MAG: sigma-54-dependent transcriptional regulator [Hydrogenophaga sp.]